MVIVGECDRQDIGFPRMARAKNGGRGHRRAVNTSAATCDITFQRSDLDTVFSLGCMQRVECLQAAFWLRVLQSIDLLMQEGVASRGGLRWDYHTSPARHDEFSITPISDRQMRREYDPRSQSIGVIEWAQFLFGGGRVVVASVPQAGRPEIMIYADHEDALLRLYAEIVRLGLCSSGRQKRRPAVAAILLSAGIALVATLVTGTIQHHRHHQRHAQWGLSEMGLHANLTPM